MSFPRRAAPTHARAMSAPSACAACWMKCWKRTARRARRTGLVVELLFASRPSGWGTEERWERNIAQSGHVAQDLQFRARTHTIRNKNRPEKQLGNQRRLN